MTRESSLPIDCEETVCHFLRCHLRYVLSDAEKSRVAVNSYKLPGVAIEPQFVRQYPLPSLRRIRLAMCRKSIEPNWILSTMKSERIMAVQTTLAKLE